MPFELSANPRTFTCEVASTAIRNLTEILNAIHNDKLDSHGKLRFVFLHYQTENERHDHSRTCKVMSTHHLLSSRMLRLNVIF